MSWTQVSSSVYQRPIDEVERLNKAVAASRIENGQYCPLITSIVLTIAIPTPSHGDFLDAWKRLRYMYPLLAAQIESDRYQYNVPDPMTLSTWLAESLHVFPIQDKTEIDDILVPFYLFPYAQLTVLQRTGEIVLRSHGFHMDGECLYVVANKLLELLAKPQPESEMVWGEEISNLAPSMSQALGIVDVENKEVFQPTMQGLRETASRQATALTPKQNSSNLAGKTEYFRLRLTSDRSDRIKQLCRKWDVSVAAVLHAALVLVIKRQDQSAKKAKGHTTGPDSVCAWVKPLSVRHHVNPDSNLASMPGVCCTTVPLKVNTPFDAQMKNPSLLKDLASEFDITYREMRDSSDLLNVLSGWHQILAKEMLSVTDEASPPSVSFSCINWTAQVIQEIPDDEHAVKLVDWWVHSEQIGKNIGLQSWETNGRLNMQVLYRDNWYEDLYVKGLLYECKTTLIRESASSESAKTKHANMTGK